MQKFIFKRHKGGILHVLGNGRTVFYDYEKITAMKPVIDKYLEETEFPAYLRRSDYNPLKAVDR